MFAFGNQFLNFLESCNVQFALDIVDSLAEFRLKPSRPYKSSGSGATHASHGEEVLATGNSLKHLS